MGDRIRYRDSEFLNARRLLLAVGLSPYKNAIINALTSKLAGRYRL